MNKLIYISIVSVVILYYIYKKREERMKEKFTIGEMLNNINVPSVDIFNKTSNNFANGTAKNKDDNSYTVTLLGLLSLAVLVYIYLVMKHKVQIIQKQTISQMLDKITIPYIRGPDCFLSGDSMCANSVFGSKCVLGYCSN